MASTKRKVPRTHHFLVFRHCIRASKSSQINMGPPFLNEDPLDYLGNTPHWTSELGSCIPLGNQMTQATGEWMVTGNSLRPPLIDTGDKVQWEFIVDDMVRDHDTAYFLAQGIDEGLAKKNPPFNRSSSALRVGLKTFHVIDDFFTSDDDDWISDPNLSMQQMTRNLETKPRPSLSFVEAINLMQTLAGLGRKGNLTENEQFMAQLLQAHPDTENDLITGAPALLDFFARALFYSRGGKVDVQRFCPDATVRQIYQLVQFIHWNKAILWADTNWSARQGAYQAYVMMQVLDKGYYLPSTPATSYEFLVRNDDDYYTDELVDGDDVDKNDDYFDFDTKVTILVGHNADLHVMATALDVQWILREPYLSGPGGAFLPTAPLSGIHAVRYLDTDRIELSVVYPMIVDEKDSLYDLDGSYFPVNVSGILEFTPLLFQRPVPSSGLAPDKSSTYIQGTSTPNHEQSSLKILETHILNVLSSYGEQRVYHAAKQWYNQEVKAFNAVFPGIGTIRDGNASKSISSSNHWLVKTVLLAAILICVWVVRKLSKFHFHQYHRGDLLEKVGSFDELQQDDQDSGEEMKSLVP